MILYAIEPIDWRWNLLPTLSDIAMSSCRDEYEEDEIVQDLFDSYARAMKAAEKSWWEGDFSQKPRVLLLPSGNEFEFGFVWKQNNGGMTFVASPVPLGNLEDENWVYKQETKG